MKKASAVIREISGINFSRGEHGADSPDVPAGRYRDAQKNDQVVLCLLLIQNRLLV